MSTEKLLVIILALGFVIVIVQWLVVGLIALLIVSRVRKSVKFWDETSRKLSNQATDWAEKLAPAAVLIAISRGIRKFWGR